MVELGLIGKTLKHSFSQKYFTEKFEKEGIKDHAYHLFELAQIEDFPRLWSTNPHLKGLNVTVPYKQEVIPFLQHMDQEAQAIGAVNVIKKMPDGSLKGFNSDVDGFRQSLMKLIGQAKPKALVLGTGGASKAVTYVLQQLRIDFQLVSRKSENGSITYSEINLQPEILKDRHLIINGTPLGTFPDVHLSPDLPYEVLDSRHFLFDLVYNPPLTKFMEMGKNRGAKVINGYEMLVGQAERAWSIWNQH